MVHGFYGSAAKRTLKMVRKLSKSSVRPRGRLHHAPPPEYATDAGIRPWKSSVDCQQVIVSNHHHHRTSRTLCGNPVCSSVVAIITLCCWPAIYYILLHLTVGCNSASAAIFVITALFLSGSVQIGQVGTWERNILGWIAWHRMFNAGNSILWNLISLVWHISV